MESCSKIKDGNGKLVRREDEVKRILRGYFEDLYRVYII